MYVYYYRTYEKAVSGGGEREKGGHVLRDKEEYEDTTGMAQRSMRTRQECHAPGLARETQREGRGGGEEEGRGEGFGTCD